MKTWQGNEIDSKQPENTILIFGSNPQGRHGTGLALFARKYFGAIYGQGRGLQGNSYGLITKNITAPFTEYFENLPPIRYNKSGFNSIPISILTDNIVELLNCINKHPHLNFILPYTRTGKNLSGFSSMQIFNILKLKGIPPNLIVHHSLLSK